MGSIQCPKCAAAFLPVPGYAAASCPFCGNVVTLAITTSPASHDPFAFAESAPSEPVTYRRARLQPGSGYGVASMTLGIVAICFLLGGCLFWPLAIISFICAILATIFGMVGAGTEGAGMALAGRVLGLVTLGIDVLFFLVTMGLLGFIASQMPSAREREREQQRIQRELDQLERDLDAPFRPGKMRPFNPRD